MRKPTLYELLKRPAWWIDYDDDLRITLPRLHDDFLIDRNFWFYVDEEDEWFSSFLSLNEVREDFEFGGFL